MPSKRCSKCGKGYAKWHSTVEDFCWDCDIDTLGDKYGSPKSDAARLLGEPTIIECLLSPKGHGFFSGLADMVLDLGLTFLSDADDVDAAVDSGATFGLSPQERITAPRTPDGYRGLIDVAISKHKFGFFTARDTITKKRFLQPNIVTNIPEYPLLIIPISAIEELRFNEDYSGKCRHFHVKLVNGKRYDFESPIFAIRIEALVKVWSRLVSNVGHTTNV